MQLYFEQVIDESKVAVQDPEVAVCELNLLQVEGEIEFVVCEGGHEVLEMGDVLVIIEVDLYIL